MVARATFVAVETPAADTVPAAAGTASTAAGTAPTAAGHYSSADCMGAVGYPDAGLPCNLVANGQSGCNRSRQQTA